MRKTLIAALTFSILLPSNSALANSEEVAEAICGYIEIDNKNRLRKVLKEKGLRVRNIFDSVWCDGQDMLRFAIKSNANSAGGFILSQLPVQALSEPGADGKTLFQWAEEFGHTSSPLVISAQDKVNE
jgi:hypothetical protein